MTIEQFVALMSGIESATAAVQSVVTSAAIVIAGIWALVTFWALGQITRAKAELQQVQLEHTRAQKQISESELQQRKIETEIRKLQQEAKVGEVIEISIKATQCTLPNDSSRYVSAVVEIENRGIVNTRLAYEKRSPDGIPRPFFVHAAKVNDTGMLEFREQASCPVPMARNPQSYSPSVLVPAQGKESIPFFFRVRDPGLYMLVFWARASEEVQNRAKESGFEAPGNWVAKEYLIIQ